MTAVVEIEILAEGLGHPEGPDVLRDGGILFVEADSGRVCVWYPDRAVVTLAATGGAPYGSTLGSDGWIYVTQSGANYGGHALPRPQMPSIQRISPDGAVVQSVCSASNGEPYFAPNDLVWGRDGRLYFTDSGLWEPDNPTQSSAIHAVSADGLAEKIIDLGPVFANGIGCEADGSIIWLESYTRVIGRLRPDGRREVVARLPAGQTPEGVAIDSEGNLWITTFEAGLVAVLSRDGRTLREIEVGGVPVNCTFVDDWLYVTDFGSPVDPGDEDSLRPGRLLRMRVDAKGMPMTRGFMRL
ncbi:SMP-30/gluconolactonase/LRE family protein (plasmid) [Rhizobium sp. CB3171]|uniref:SMP-30/gluconolactonase/LRE family protein n=1 Tax=unclassified Rhizobium TaxID=2613769 RepID=UPI00131A4D35|nr:MULTISPECIES: SMP-30/gluconolactonase/LRE family protein [Rhizobium]UWU24348.1 SMP-30/gluconolactonase/LRE family protein [Rhizobium tropici]WFU05328.1 SMP-30/gluconolactonase/LRE family protein [Rhizobium sp. CB3171]